MSNANTRKSAVKAGANAAALGSVTASDDFFGQPPLLEGEDGAAYFDLLEKVRASVKPRNVLEEIATRDFVDITWEILRLRRMRQPVIVAGYSAALEKILTPSVEFLRLRSLRDKWLSGDDDARQKVAEVMERAGLTMTDLQARAIDEKIDTIERIDRMTAQAEHRRRLVIDELDRSRDALARRLREAANIINVDASTGVGGAPRLTSVARAP
jgi:hypothetical protein